MAQISENFDENRIPVPSDEFSYRYYDAIAFDILETFQIVLGDVVEVGDSLLDAKALEAIPGETFTCMKFCIYIYILALRALVISNLVFGIIKDVFAIITFLDVSLTWLESTMSTALNRDRRTQSIRRFRLFVRAIEVTYFFILFLLVVLLINSNGSSYSVAQNVFTFLLSFFIVTVYCIGRNRLQFHFVTSRLTTYDPSSKALWKVIRNVSTVVIAANVGVLFVQMYSMIEITRFEDLVDAYNDPVCLFLKLVFSLPLLYFFFKISASLLVNLRSMCISLERTGNLEILYSKVKVSMKNEITS